MGILKEFLIEIWFRSAVAIKTNLTLPNVKREKGLSEVVNFKSQRPQIWLVGNLALQKQPLNY